MPRKYFCTYKMTAAPTKDHYSYTSEDHLHLGGTFKPMKCSYSYTDEVQLHLRGTYTKKVQLHQQRTSIPIRYIYITVMRYINTYKVHIHLQGTPNLRGHLYLQGIATTTRYSYTYEAQLHLCGNTTPMEDIPCTPSWNSLQLWCQTVQKYNTSTNKSDVL
jgi:hypothetical protein